MCVARMQENAGHTAEGAPGAGREDETDGRVAGPAVDRGANGPPTVLGGRQGSRSPGEGGVAAAYWGRAIPGISK